MPRASPSNSLEVGLDIVEVGRFRRVVRRTPRFLSRVFTDSEIAYCRRHKDPWTHFAVRFAAKEAVWKALGQAGLGLKDISVSRDERGKPGVLLKGRKAPGFKLSLTHTDEYAAAVAVRLSR